MTWNFRFKPGILVPRKRIVARPWTFIDLFAGAGGLSEGFARQGFLPVSHVEMNKDACETLLTRAFYYELRKSQEGMEFYRDYLRGNVSKEDFRSKTPEIIKNSVICETMSEETLPSVFNRIDAQMKAMHVRKIDIVIGGPPCQAYSIVGRSRKDMSTDPRNKLYLLYLEVLRRYQPKLFVFENVQGITTAAGGEYFEDMQNKSREYGYELEARLLKSEDYGVLQKRRRMILIGIRKDQLKINKHFPFPEQIYDFDDFVVDDLLSDLPALEPGQSSSEYAGPASPYLVSTGIRKDDDILTWHIARPLNPHDAQIYNLAIAHWNSEHRVLDYSEYPEQLKTHRKQTVFQDRFKVVPGDAHTCQTMVAHIAKDGHYYIHPDINQCRSITVREAARIQSFPDDFYFEGSRTAAFTQIGNAVPPLLACHVAAFVRKYLG